MKRNFRFNDQSSHGFFFWMTVSNHYFRRSFHSFIKIFPYFVFLELGW